MTKTKRALLTSGLALLLCMSMLIGSTYAWFTDSVTSAGNIIKSGTLDVEMYWADGTEDPASVTWKNASEGAIFNYDKWEPGYTEVRHIKIENVGTLALKYQLSIVANGEITELANVIDVYYVDNATQLDERADISDSYRLGTLAEVLANISTTASGNLKAGNAHTVTLALKMQESAGNQYQDKSIGTDFSVILMATQLTSEFDSFDDQYDDTEIPEMHIETIDGVTYGRGIDGNYYMISVDDYTLTSFTVDEDVTVLGTGNGENDNDRIFGKNAPLASLTLNEGLVEIKDNALNALPNLTSVNIPSTVKTIGIQAFRITGMSELTIPENVETVKAGAFRDMANLTTVTVEGNVAFDNYAFRSCPKLESIYLLGDDVTIAGNMFATHSDKGDANGITIYVKNATVAARVYAAQTSAYGYEVKILGDLADGSDAQAVSQVTTQTALNEALASGESVVLKAGTYKMPSSGTASDVSIVGTKDTVIDLTMGAYMQSASSVTIEGVTVKTGTGKANSNGSDYAALYSSNTTYKNCTFVGPMRLGGDGTRFIDCTFTELGNDYVWNMQWDTSFEGCTFATNGKALLLYADGSFNCDGVANVSVKNCIFTSTAGAKAGAIANQNCAAIEIHNYGTSINLETAGNTYDSNFSGEWRIKTLESNGRTVTVNGVNYTTIAIDGKTMTIDSNKNVTVNE